MVKSISIHGLLMAIGLVGCAGDVAGEEVGFDVLIAMAERYELPRPPKDAPLVLANTDSISSTESSSSSDDPGMYAPAFLLKRLPEDKVRVLVGWDDRVAETNADFRPAIRRYSLVQPKEDPKGYDLSYLNRAAIVTAVQLAQRGERLKAAKLWTLVVKETLELGFAGGKYNHWPSGQWIDRAYATDPRKMFAYCMFQHFYDAAFRRNVDAKEIHSKLVQMRREFPYLFSEDPKQYGHDRWLFVEDFGWNARAKKPPEDSAEALLVEWGHRDSDHEYAYASVFAAEGTDAPAYAICHRGIAAIADLVELSDDRRITRNIISFDDRDEELPRLGVLARELLAGMLGSQDLSIVAALWEQEDWDRLFFERAAVKIQDGELVRYHATPLWILAMRHPRSLITLCRTIPAKPMPEVYPSTLGQAVLHSKLTAEEKRQAMLSMCDRLEKHSPNRIPLWLLVKVDQQRCISYIRPTLVEVAQGRKKPESGCGVFSHGWLVMQLHNDDVWKLYVRVVKRFSTSQRMKTIHRFNDEETLKNNRQRLLAFLAVFLDDQERHESSVAENFFSEAHSDITLGKIAVGDFAAAQISSILGFDERPAKSWTDEQWTELRTKVKAALKKEKLPVLEDQKE